jgi:hypothetical protein
MVDAKDVGFIEDAEQNLIQFLRGRQIVPERLLHNNPGAMSAVGFGEMLDHGFKQNRRDCQIMCRAFRVFELLAKRGEGCRILVVTVDIAQQAAQLFESGGIHPTMFLQAVFRASAKLIEIPSSFGYADDGYIEMSSLHHCLQGGENLLVSEIAGGAEENKRV